MYDDVSTADLKTRLAKCEATVRQLKSFGAAWALDCRQMRVAEANGRHIRNEIRRREREQQEVK